MTAHEDPWVWVSADNGEIMTPDAMEQIIALDRGLLVGRTASTLVLRDAGREVVFHRVRESNYV